MAGPNTVNFPAGIQIPVPIWLVDANGNQITSFGGGTQYTTGNATPGSPIGTLPVFDNAGTIAKVSNSVGLPVNVVAGAAGGTALADDAAFTVGTTTFTPIGGLYNDSAAAATSGHADAARLSQNRGLHVNIRNNAGTELATSSNPLQVSLANTAANATPVADNLTQVGGTSITLGSKASASSLPVVIASDQGAIAIQHGNVIDSGNSSTATLTANSVFTGTGTSSLNYSALSIEVFADQASAASGLQVQQSQDNSNWDISDTFSVSASTAFNTVVNLVGQFYRIKYTNGGTNQGTFRLQTIKSVADPVLPRTLTAAGSMRVDGSSVTQPVSATNLQTNLNQIAGSNISTAASGTQLVGVADGAGNGLTSNSSTYTAKKALDANVLGTLGTAFSTAGKVDVKAAAGDIADLTHGQSNMAGSVPVAIASNQGAVAVGVTSGTAFDANSGTIGANSLRTVAGGAATGTKTNVASSASSVTVLASNTSRKGAIFYNDSTQICYLDLSGGTASSSSYSVQMPSNSYFELPGPNLYNGAVTGIWASANGNMRVTEFS